MLRHIRWIVVASVAALACSQTPAAHADERFYMIIFAAEGNPNLPRLAHTFAAFMKVEEREYTDAADWPIETHTISWLPASLDVRLLVPPERGVNLDLKATLKFEKSQGRSVSAWGPFEIRQDLYQRALTQIKRLESREVAYKALDRRFRPNTATNCFHAVSDIAKGPLLDTGTAFGEAASRMVLQHLSPWIVEPTKIHRDLRSRVGLGDFDVAFRDEVPFVAKSVKESGR